MPSRARVTVKKTNTKTTTTTRTRTKAASNKASKGSNSHRCPVCGKFMK